MRLKSVHTLEGSEAKCQVCTYACVRIVQKRFETAGNGITGKIGDGMMASRRETSRGAALIGISLDRVIQSLP